MDVSVVSPEQILWEGEASQVLARTLDGEIAFLNGHAPFIGALDVSQVKVWTGAGEPLAFDVSGGFVEVSNNTVTILADIAGPDAGGATGTEPAT
jgi:F-type H+-transporting ATPase subunit epsilon